MKFVVIVSAIVSFFYGTLGAVSNSSTQVIRIGGVFPVTDLNNNVDPVGNQRMAGFIMAIKALNEEYKDRNITIKVAARDSKRSFTNTVKASLELVTTVFDGDGCHAVIGAGTNLVTKAMAFILQDFDIAQIAYGSDSAELSHASLYPDFMRVYPSTSFQAAALADIIYRRYGIPRVVIAYSTDTYGTDALALFEANAGDSGGPQILATIGVTPGQVSDYSAKIKAAKALSPRAVIMLISDASTAARFMEQGYSGGLLGGSVFIFGTSVFSDGSVWTAMGDPKAAKALMQSTLAVGAADADWKQSSSGKEFITKFVAQNNTIYKAADGTDKCDNTTDDDGGFYLYQAKVKSNGVYTYECTGVNFTALNKDGSDMANFPTYIYDSTLAIVRGIVGYADKYHDGIIPDTISGIALKHYIVTSTSFEGASGPIKFSKTDPRIYDYAYGDRTTGIHYSLFKFASTSTDSSTVVSDISRFGTWKSEGGLQLSTKEDPLRVIRIGGVFPMTTLTGAIDPVGIQRLAAFVMAVEDLTVQYSQLNYTIKIAIRNSQWSFTNTAKGSLDLATGVFGTTGVHGAIGAGANPTSKAMAFILQDSDIAQIAYATDASDLSHQAVYPNFLRVSHSSSLQGYALADIVYKKFGYKRVVVIYSTDVFGSDALAEFRGRALELDVDILATAPISAGQISSYADAINSLKIYDPRIFVLLVGTVSYASKFLEESIRLRLISSHSLVLGTAAITTSSLWKDMSDPTAEKILTDIYLGLSYTDSDWMVTTQGKKFLQRIRSQPSTAGYTDSTTGVTTCNNATDDDGGFYLYQVLNVQGTDYECTGQVFSDYAANGVNMSHYSAHIYDATVAMVHGIVSYSSIYNGGLLPDQISGKLLKQILIKNVTFEGPSGLVSFSSGRDHIYNYGIGDRVTGIRFAISDINPGNGSSSQYRFERFATWRSEGGFILCEDELSEYGYFEALTGACTGFHHSELPAERASFLIQVMPSSMRASLFFLAALQFVAFLFVGFGLVRFRRKRLTKASQPPMMWLVLSMCIWGAARTIAAAYYQSSTEVCLANYWTGHLAFSGIIALFVKTLRVHLLVNAAGLKRMKISTAQVLGGTAAIVTLLLVYMGISTAVSKPHAAMRMTTAITGQDTHIYFCQTDVGALDYVIYAFEAGILLFAAKLCYDTKDLPDAINETKVIAFAIFFIVVVCAIGFPLVFVLGLDPYFQEMVIGACFAVAILFTTAVYFGPKLSLLFSGADLNAKFQIVRKNKSKKELAAQKQAEQLAAAEAEAEAEKYRKYMVSIPKDADTCEGLINYLRGELMKINMKAQQGSGFSGSSGQSGLSSNPASVVAQVREKSQFQSQYRSQHGNKSVYDGVTYAATSSKKKKLQSVAEAGSEMIGGGGVGVDAAAAGGGARDDDNRSVHNVVEEYADPTNFHQTMGVREESQA